MPKILAARPPQNEAEAKKIHKLVGARHAPADWIQRAQIIQLSWQGLHVPAIAEKLGCHAKTVRRWLHRFNAAGLDGLGDRPGCGRKRRITEIERSKIIALARSDPPGHPLVLPSGTVHSAQEGGPPTWSLDALTQAAHGAGITVGRSQVRRILQAEGVRWRRTHSWATSDDPQFAPKGRK